MKKSLLLYFLLLIDIILGYQGKMYNRWRSPLRRYGFTWKAVPAKTDDGYTLMLFHVTGTKGGGDFKSRRTPVLLVGDIWTDAARWMEL